MPPVFSRCFCCSPQGRVTQDEATALDIVARAPAHEWTLPWSPENLMPQTGSKQITSYVILFRVFLHLPLDLYTLLAVGGVCRAWRVASDRLPHWRYLLPLRNEVLTIASSMSWDEPARFALKPFTDPRGAPPERQHYVYEARRRLDDYVPDVCDACLGCNCEMCKCDACSCPCSDCSDADSDYNEEKNLRVNKTRDLVRAHGQSVGLPNANDMSQALLTDRAFPDPPMQWHFGDSADFAAPPEPPTPPSPPPRGRRFFGRPQQTRTPTAANPALANLKTVAPSDERLGTTRSDWGKFWTTPIRAQHKTLDQHAGVILGNAEYRRTWMFPSRSAFVAAAERSRDLLKNNAGVTWWERYKWLPCVVLTLLALSALTLSVSYVIGYHVERTIIPPNDYRIGLAVAFITITITWLGLFFTSCLAESKMRDTLEMKSFALGCFVYSFAWIAIPMALCAFRVSTAEHLLTGGSTDLCDAYAPDMPFSFPYPVLGNSSQNISSHACALPALLLPSRLARSTFGRFPPGTQLLYHPPGVRRIVPWAAMRPSAGNDTCSVRRDAAVPWRDAGHNQSITDVFRGHIGYYTVILPLSSCRNDSNSTVRNFTVLILGDADSCPFWSSSFVNGSADAPLLHARFEPVLHNNSAATAQAVADGVDPALGAALRSNATQPPCSSASNALITVRNDTMRQFHLRVSTGWQPHWTSSYYIARVPFDSGSEPGPWIGRPTWEHTLDYKLNGIVAFMADTPMFLAHANTATPTVPIQISPFEGTFSDNDTAPFWTAAHPAGLRRLRGDFLGGVRGMLFAAVGLLGAAGLLTFAARSRLRLLYFAFCWCCVFLVTVPIAATVITSLCWAHSRPTDAWELSQPVFCLGARGGDIRPAWVACTFFLALWAAGAIYGVILFICE